MSSRNRSSSVQGLRDYIPRHQLAPRKTSTAYSRPTEDPIRTRSRSVSRNPTNRVPLNRATEDNKTRRTSGTSDRFSATFESLADPRFSAPDTPTPRPTHRPIRGILRNPSQSPHQGHNHSGVSFDRSSQDQTATPTRNLFANPAHSSANQVRTMSGRATARAKARDDIGSRTAGGANKKPVHVNGGRSSKKAIASSDEGSSSSDEDSSDSSSDSSSDEESSASERESKKGLQKSAGAHVGTKKPAASLAAANRGQKKSSSDEDSDTSSDSEVESGGAKVAPVREIPDSSTDSSEEESEESEGEAQPAQKTRKDAKKAETPVSSSSSSEEEEEEEEDESDEEMEDAPPSGQAPFNSSKTSRAGILTSGGGAPVPAPSTMDGGFKLQKAQNLGQMAALLNEANAKGDRVWLLTHPSSTPLNLEVQHIFSAPEHHRNSIVPNGVKLTYPVSADGKNFHAISGCNSITVTQTARNDTDVSSLTQAVSKSLMSAKEAPVQPAGLRSRYLPIGVGSRASPTLEDSPAAPLPSASKKKKDKASALPASSSEPSDERPSKKRKVAAESSSQPAAEPDSEKPKKSSSRKSKSKSKDLPLEETPSKSSKAKSKVKFTSDEAARSSTPVPLPAIPSSQVKETPSSQMKDSPSSQPKSGKKKRRLSNDGGDASEKKKEKKEKKKRATPSSSWSRPDDVKVTPVAPPAIPGMR